MQTAIGMPRSRARAAVAGEAGDVAQPFEVDADARDLVHVEVGLDDLRDVEHGLVADAGEKRERQRALAHRHVDAEVAALQHHGDAALPPLVRVRARARG